MTTLLVCGFNVFGQFSRTSKTDESEGSEILWEFTDIDLEKCLEQNTVTKQKEKDSGQKDLEEEDRLVDMVEKNLDLNTKKDDLCNDGQVTESNIKEKPDYNDLIISCGWSYVIYALPRSLIVKGLLSGNTNYQRSLSLHDLLDEDDAIKYVSSCDYQSLILTNNGKVFKFTPGTETMPELIEFHYDPGELAVIDFVGCGNNILTAISNENIIFDQEKIVDQLPFDFVPKQLECGFEHALLLGYNGDMYTWGNGIRGQLGSGTLERRSTPYLVEALAGIQILTIGAGGWQSAALSIFGDIYIWGFNKIDYQDVGVYKVADRLHQPDVHDLPYLMDLPMNCCSRRDTESMNNDFSIEGVCVPINVTVGARHIAFLTTCGTVYTCGCNSYGQLGLPASKGQHNFKIAKTLPINNNLKIDNVQLQAQCWNTFIRISNPKKTIG